MQREARIVAAIQKFYSYQWTEEIRGSWIREATEQLFWKYQSKEDLEFSLEQQRHMTDVLATNIIDHAFPPPPDTERMQARAACCLDPLAIKPPACPLGLGFTVCFLKPS